MTNAEAIVSTREDKGSTRTAIILKKGGTTSLDILTHDGRLLCRLNISEFNTDTIYQGNVDVIVNPLEQSVRFGAWQNGVRVVDKETIAIAAHSVAINKRH